MVEQTVSSYDGFNRMIKSDIIKAKVRTIVEYAYNGDGLRVEKTVKRSDKGYAAEVTSYFYDRQHVILETRGNADIRYIRGINYITRIDNADKLSYFLFNGHGDVVQTVSESGDIENQYDYDIFGNPTLTVENYLNSIRYSGEFYDTETGLYYLRARYYDPYIGRFISEDSYWGEDKNPLSLNMYTYCENDPLKYIDPTGHKPAEGATTTETASTQNNKKKDRDNSSELRKEQERRRREEAERKRKLEELKRQEEARKRLEEERKRQEEERKKKEEEAKKKEEAAKNAANKAVQGKRLMQEKFEASQAPKVAEPKPSIQKPEVQKSEPKQVTQQETKQEPKEVTKQDNNQSLEQEKQMMRQASAQGNGGTSSDDVLKATTSEPEKKAAEIVGAGGRQPEGATTYEMSGYNNDYIESQGLAYETGGAADKGTVKPNLDMKNQVSDPTTSGFVGVHKVLGNNYHTSIIIFVGEGSEYYNHEDFISVDNSKSKYVTIGAGPDYGIGPLRDKMISGLKREKDKMLDIKVELIPITVDDEKIRGIGL